MKNTFLLLSLFTFVCFFFISCEKDYSCEGCRVPPPRVAVFSLDGGTSSCTGAEVSGTFTEGTAATASNTVLLSVTVDSIGTYTVTTPVVDGLYFTGSGVFTRTGTNTITLTAAGTPTSDGTFNFIPGTTGCSFSIIVQPLVDTTFSYYYEATIDGVFYKEVVTTTNGNQTISGSSSTNDAVINSSIIPISYPPMPAGKTGMSISKQALHNYFAANNTEFITFFNLGNYPYNTSPTSTADGVIIIWYDENGKEWSTANAPADQTGSNLQIVTDEEVATAPVYTIAVTFNFNCKLYDATGNVKTLTNGKFRGEFRKV